MIINFGALSPPLKEQLREYVFNEDEIDILQEDIDAINRLHIKGMLTDSATQAAEKKIIKKIAQACRRKEPT